MAQTSTRPLLILGSDHSAVDLAVRRLAKAKDSKQSLVVLDYLGFAANVLNANNRQGLQASNTMWLDLASKRKPVALFRLRNSAVLHPALAVFFKRCMELMGQPFSVDANVAACELVLRLTKSGTVGLVAIATTLRRPELLAHMRCAIEVRTQLDALAHVLEWLLAFPAIWACSEGNNTVELDKVLRLGGTLWLCCPTQYMQRIERIVVGWMCEVALAQAYEKLGFAPLQQPAYGNGEPDNQTPSRAGQVPLLLCVYPSKEPITMGLALQLKHVGVLAWQMKSTLSVAGSAWLGRGADCWVIGPVTHAGQPQKLDKNPWLSEPEQRRLTQLKATQVWVRSGADGKAVTVLAKAMSVDQPMAQLWRNNSQKSLTESPAQRFGWWPDVVGDSAKKGFDGLYAVLCQPETLYAGWLRVKTGRKTSHGVDRMTIAEFGATLDDQMRQLAQELQENRYQCRPLRTVLLPKPDGDVRPVRVSCVRDRVVQSAMLHLLQPLFDPGLSRRSFAYRAGRGAHHALALARSGIHSGKHWVVVADIRKCFDSVDHEVLLRLVGDVVSDRDVLRLLRHWLNADVIDFADVVPMEIGVAQGDIISPLLANIYLDPMDKEFERLGIVFKTPPQPSSGHAHCV